MGPEFFRHLDRQGENKRPRGLVSRPSRLIPQQLEAFEALLEGLTPRDLLLRYNGNRFVEPSSLGQKERIFLEKLFYRILPDNYEDIELSPVAPLGINSLLAPLSQRMIISAVRNLEVLADSTSMMAFEIAKRGQRQPRALAEKRFVVDLSSSARLTRAQLFSQDSGFKPHFQAFALASGGVTSPEIETKKMGEHLSLFLKFLREANASGYSAGDIKVYISNIAITEKLIQQLQLDRSFLGRHSQDSNFHLFQECGLGLPGKVDSLGEIDQQRTIRYGFGPQLQYLKRRTERQMGELRETFPEVTFKYDLERIAGIGYYGGLCYKITARTKDGKEYPLADGGYSRWLADFWRNERAFFCSGGFGLELFAINFKS